MLAGWLAGGRAHGARMYVKRKGHTAQVLDKVAADGSGVWIALHESTEVLLGLEL